MKWRSPGVLVPQKLGPSHASLHLGGLELFLSMVLLSPTCCSMGQPPLLSCVGRTPGLGCQSPSCSLRCLWGLWDRLGEQILNPLSNPWDMGITLQDTQNVGGIGMSGLEKPSDAAPMSCP